MEVFEIHITGDERIIEAAKQYDLKTISVELLRPDGSVLRTEHMTSHVMNFPNYDECLKKVLELRDALQRECDIYRVKVECPVYDHYIRRSLYLESHFDTKEFDFPISRNVRKKTLMGTDRTYNKEDYSSFMKKWEGKILEIALFDTFIEEDRDWLSLWHK